jgi:hypothetical protein
VWAAPAAPPRRRLWAVVAVGGVAAAGVLLAVAVVLKDDAGVPHPDQWDARVADLAAFVERERGLEFDHPVTVDFLSEDEYSERARVDESMLTDEDREAIEESGTVLEALGLVPLDTDLFATSNEMADTGTLAFYDPLTETVTVRGTEMTVALQVTLVHELVHVAQDQAFDLEQPPPDDSSGAIEAYDALVEGDAVRVELAYADSLSSEEQDAYYADATAQYDESEAGLAHVPTALQALFAAPYVLGQPVVDLIVENGGNEAVDDAFGDPPATSEHLFDPRAYFAGDAPVDVDEPGLPDGADAIGEADALGATTLFVMLAERIDPLVALSAADGWGGDVYVAYGLDERTCVRAAFAGDTAADTDEIAQALQAWTAAGPAGAASVVAGAEEVAFESCAAELDGGTRPPATGRSLDALGLPAARAQLMAAAEADGGLDHGEAFAFGDCFVRRVPLDTLTQANESADPPAGVAEAVDTAMVECMRGVTASP